MPVPASRELDMLNAAVTLLLAEEAPNPDLNYPPDADSVWFVDAPQIKHLAEFTTAYFVSPGDVIYTPDTACQVRSAGDFIVTAVTRHTSAEELASTDYEAADVKKLKMVADLIQILNGASPNGVLVLLAARNLTLEVDGWAVVQCQFSFEDSQAGSTG